MPGRAAEALGERQPLLEAQQGAVDALQPADGAQQPSGQAGVTPPAAGARGTAPGAVCRYCLEEEEAGNLEAPCQCAGTMQVCCQAVACFLRGCCGGASMVDRLPACARAPSGLAASHLHLLPPHSSAASRSGRTTSACSDGWMKSTTKAGEGGQGRQERWGPELSRQAGKRGCLLPILQMPVAPLPPPQTGLQRDLRLAVPRGLPRPAAAAQQAPPCGAAAGVPGRASRMPCAARRRQGRHRLRTAFLVASSIQGSKFNPQRR